MCIYKVLRSWLDFSCKIHAHAIKPIFKLKDNDDPYHAGTCFGVIVSGKKYLITANHVLLKNENYSKDKDDQIYMMVNSKLQQIKSFKKITLKTDDGNMDFVAITLNNINIDTIFKKYICEKDLIDIKLDSNQYICAFGFPTSKNKIKWQQNVLTNKPYSYNGKVLSKDSLKKYGYNSNLYIGINIFLKKVFTKTQKEIKAPAPYGISGGPMIYTYNSSKPLNLFKPKVCGIVIEKTNDGKAIIGVNINNIIATLKIA